IDYKKFAAVRKIESNRGIRQPAFHPYLLPATMEQRGDLNAESVLCRLVSQRPGLDTHPCAGPPIELPQLDEEHAARRGARRGARVRRIADIGTGRVIAMLVLESALKHKKLFAAVMRVRREAAGRRVAHDRGRSSDLAADAIEHPPVDPGDWRGDPWQQGRM